MPETITFEAPGPGTWMLDTTHHGRRPLTPYLRRQYQAIFESTMPILFERYGLPLARMRSELVNGCEYVRPMALGEPDDPSGRTPPRFVLKALFRLNPQLRRRNRTARQAWEERRWRDDVDRWTGGLREQAVNGNLAIQAETPGALDDRELVDHLARATAHFGTLAAQGFALHGGDLIPVGDYLAHCAAWGIDRSRAAGLLAGASPASIETAQILAPVAAAVTSAPSGLDSVTAVRALGPEVDAAVSRWLELHGWRLLFSDDLDSPTLAESPSIQLRALLAATEVRTPNPDPAAVRTNVPAAERERFDDVLTEARYGLRLRDDAVGIGWNWPAGLVRRALLDVGRRLVERGQVDGAEQALLLEQDEVAPLLVDEDGPSRAEMARRSARRQAVIAARPPISLGPPEEQPPVEAFPAPLRRATRAMLIMIDAMNGEDSTRPLHGHGVGTSVYRGRARVLVDIAAAFESLRDGDVVVTGFTGPTWSSLLPMVGAIVVEEGGVMCHAAIVAREFGLPAVVGVTGATAAIPDGAEVEVDPVAGVVRVFGPVPSR